MENETNQANQDQGADQDHMEKLFHAEQEVASVTRQRDAAVTQAAGLEVALRAITQGATLHSPGSATASVPVELIEAARKALA